MAQSSASVPSREILEVALQGLESQRQKLDEQISEVRRLLSGRGATAKKATKSASKNAAKSASSGRSGARKKRTLSAEARARIAAAQKKRWAAFRKNQS